MGNSNCIQNFCDENDFDYDNLDGCVIGFMGSSITTKISSISSIPTPVINIDHSNNRLVTQMAVIIKVIKDPICESTNLNCNNYTLLFTTLVKGAEFSQELFKFSTLLNDFITVGFGESNGDEIIAQTSFNSDGSLLLTLFDSSKSTTHNSTCLQLTPLEKIEYEYGTAFTDSPSVSRRF